MAEVPVSPSQEPSMEEILASIRKIISDDKAADAPDAQASGGDDILELTQLVEEDGSVVDLAAPSPMSVEQTVNDQPSIPLAPNPPMSVLSENASGLASDQAISSAAAALAALVNTTKIERMATASQSGLPIGNGARTLEDMVLESLRPVLKEWLDQNLTAIVERLVQKEVERITRQVD